MADALAAVIVVDGDTGGQERVDPAAGGLTVAAFNEALKEDNKALAAEFGVAAEPVEGGAEADGDEHEVAVAVSEAVWSVRSADEPYNWVLIGPR